MPELPEVETIRRVLEPQIKGLRIEKTTVNRSEVIAYPTAAEFCSTVDGQTICGMGRRGKYLQILLESGDSLVLHLRMTGCLLLTPVDYPVQKHTHVVFHLNGDKELRFTDTRRFGRFWLFQSGSDDTYSGIGKLGLEPFDKNFCAEYLQVNYSKRKKTIKECLLDQTIVSGVGNIYSDEILFTVKIRPDRPANSLNTEEWHRIAEAVPKQLSYFIEKNMITPDEYLESKGQNYRNTPFLQVYGRDGQPCQICGTSLCRTTIAGRSSVFCPSCQQGIGK